MSGHSSTTSIHRASVGEAKTACGIELLHRVEEECVLPTLVARKRTMGEVKVVTTVAYDCRSCARQRARAAEKAKGATS